MSTTCQGAALAVAGGRKTRKTRKTNREFDVSLSLLIIKRKVFAYISGLNPEGIDDVCWLDEEDIAQSCSEVCGRVKKKTKCTLNP